ncbi:hypothetical protein GKR75_08030 [Providencia sp. wls1919]|nr:hypothetical protein [Providencia sp. wls1919]
MPRIQVYLNDKNTQKLEEVRAILEKDDNYNSRGDISLSEAGRIMIELGLRVYLASLEKDNEEVLTRDEFQKITVENLIKLNYGMYKVFDSLLKIEEVDKNTPEGIRSILSYIRDNAKRDMEKIFCGEDESK